MILDGKQIPQKTNIFRDIYSRDLKQVFSRI
jgi:hypothetical protein